MKKCILIVLATLFTFASCVQETKKQTITVFLDVSGQKNIQTVGIRGEGNPLSWDLDLVMKEVVKDTLYKATFISRTGRLCNELKFTINGNFELQDKDNRKVYFDTKKDTTVYAAKFNVVK